MKKRIAFDQDQVLADLLTEWVSRYNTEYNDNLRPEDIKNWNWHNLVKPECGKKIYNYLDDPNLFENLPCVDGSQETLYELSKHYEIFVVTAPWNIGNVKPKYKWLKKNFPFINEKNYVFTRNKSVVNADWLVDDKEENFHGFKGTPILYDAPHNRNVSGYIRLMNMKEVKEFFMQQEECNREK